LGGPSLDRGEQNGVPWGLPGPGVKRGPEGGAHGHREGGQKVPRGRGRKIPRGVKRGWRPFKFPWPFSKKKREKRFNFFLGIYLTGDFPGGKGGVTELFPLEFNYSGDILREVNLGLTRGGEVGSP